MKNYHRTNHLASGKMLAVRLVLLMTFLIVPFGQSVSIARNADNNAVVQGSVKVTGLVQDKNGEPISGATIVEVGTNNGTFTSPDGRFSLDVTGPASVLRISFIGYTPVEQPVGSTTYFKVTLLEDQKTLNEVVVIGYGTQRKADVTSSVASVKKDEFLAGSIKDAGELIKGKVAGLTITNASGDPNSSSTIRLRGITSLMANLSPLVLIDGIEGDLGTVSPDNIQSVDVLKDASAAAIYGTRGANGVIIITTNSGKRNEATTATYSVYGTISDFYKKAKFMTPHDTRFGLTQFTDRGYDTDWLRAISQKGMAQNHDLNIVGGNSKTSYSANLSYRNEIGTIKKSNNEELKMQYDLSHWMLDDKLKISMNLVKGLHKNNVTDASNNGITNIYRQAVIRNPTEPIYVDGDKSKGYFEDFSTLQYYNPVAMINENIGDTKTEWTRITGIATLEPIKGWQTELKVSTNRYNGNTESYTTHSYYTQETDNANGTAYKGSDYSESNLLELTSKYDKVLNGVHRLSALAGYSYLYDMYESMYASNHDFLTDAYLYNNLGAGLALTGGPDGKERAYMGSHKEDSKLIGFFGRVSYGYKDKYNVLVSMRYEGSSKFGADHKWGAFPAASAGWTISNEDFMKDFSWLNNLKLRVGYGITGVIPGQSYQSLVLWNYSSAYYMNASGNWDSPLEISQNPNPKLKWETTGELNTGIDFSVLNDRLSGSVDYYEKTTHDLLYNYNVPSPPNLYTTTYANVGKLKNKGIEIVINAVPVKTKDFQYNFTVTAYHNDNKLINLSNDLYQTDNFVDGGWASDPVSLPTQRLMVGSSFGKYYSLKTKGLSENGLWMVENPETGKYEEFFADMTLVESKYRQWLGSAIPKIYLGWTNNFRYKNFDLNIQTSGQFGFKIVNEQRMFYENRSISYNRLKSALDQIPVVDENGKSTGTKSEMSAAQPQTIVSWYFENGSFFKVDHVTLGYNVDISKMKNVNSIRVYVSGQNLLCLTKYKGMDPELTNADQFSLGVDGRDKYPTIRSITVGASVNFK
jgi:TonB-dependent starch-binding outer membrane protein SusC